MERLDIYDEEINFLGSEDRDIVHQKGLWHKTVHCWIYDMDGNVYFQIRQDSHKLYTTASGHVLAGETVKQAFKREVFEEIGVDVDTNNAELVEINVWKMEKIKNGVPFIDHAFANVYINEISVNYNKFKFDSKEVLGVVKVNAKDCLELLLGRRTSIEGQKITEEGILNIPIDISDLLIFENEFGVIKYGKIVNAIICKTIG